jgi:hypothetical protein
VQLAHPRLGDPEQRPDLGQRAVLQVVEADHGLVPLTELLDGRREVAQRLAGLYDGHRVRGVVVGEQLGDSPAVLEQSLDADQLHLATEPGQITHGHAELGGQLTVGGAAQQPTLEPLLRPFHLPRPTPHASGHPVLRAELIQDRAPDPLCRVALEPRAASRVEPDHGVDEPEDAGLHEVGLVDVRGEPGRDPVGYGADQRRVVHDQAVPQRAGRRLEVGGPQRVDLGRARVGVDSGRSRCGELRRWARGGGLRDRARIGRLYGRAQVGGMRSQTQVGGLPGQTEISTMPSQTEVSRMPSQTEVGGLRGQTEVGGLRGRAQVGELRGQAWVDGLRGRVRVGGLCGRPRRRGGKPARSGADRCGVGRNLQCRAIGRVEGPWFDLRDRGHRGPSLACGRSELRGTDQRGPTPWDAPAHEPPSAARPSRVCRAVWLLA